MQNVICYKCNRSVKPLERRETDKRGKKTWLISYCPYERCSANLDCVLAPSVKLWNGSYFKDESDDDPDSPQIDLL